MQRLLTAIILSLWVLFMGTLSYGFGDYQYTIETWVISFSLPIWSIISIGLWYDTGRLLLGTTIDSKESTSPVWLRGITFIGYMSLIFTYVVWVHMSLQAIQMLMVIPILAIPLREWLVQDWGSINIPTKRELITLFIWSVCSYLTYWVLTFVWIILRVYVYDVTNDGFVFYIQ